MISDLGYFSPELLLKHHSRESSLLPAISLAIHNWESVMSQDMRISSEIFDKNSKWKPTNSTHVGFFENDSFKTWDKLLEKCGVSLKLEVLEMSSVAIFFLIWNQEQLLKKPALSNCILIRLSVKQKWT